MYRNTGPSNRMIIKGETDNINTILPTAKFSEHTGSVFSIKVDGNQMFSSGADGIVYRYIFE